MSFEHADLSRLPFPVAYPLYWMRDPDGKLEPSGRYENAILTCYQAMRLAALLMLADYLQSDESDAKVGTQVRGLRAPHWQEWTHLANALCRFWSSKDRDKHASFPNVVAGWRSVSHGTAKRHAAALDPWRELIRGFPGNQGKSEADSANEAVWALRNAEAHRKRVVTPNGLAQKEADLERVRPLAEAIVAALFATPEFELLRTAATADRAGLRIIRLVGPHPDLRFATEEAEADWIDALAPTAVAARLADKAPVPVYPLLIPSDEPESRASTGLIESIDPAPMVEAVTNSKIIVLGVDRWAEIASPHLEAMLGALGRKQVDLALKRGETEPWKIVDWARMWARGTLNKLTDTKYFPAFYLERPDLDGELDKYRSRSGRALLLLGEAGTGKSSLLARLTDRLLGGDDAHAGAAADAVFARGEAEDIIVLLSGRDAYGGTGASESSGDQLLADAVARKIGVSETGDDKFKSLRELVLHLERGGKRDTVSGRLLWLLLDGINEADRFVDLVHALDGFPPALAEAPRTRLVVSMRSGAFQALAVRDARLGTHGAPAFHNANCFLKFPDARGKEQPWLEVRPFRLHDEGPRAYELRREKLPGKAANVPYDQLSRPLKQLLLTPLYLHLFHETFAGRADAPGDLDEGQLLDAYLGRLAGSSSDSIAGASGWLDRLAETMLRQRRAFLPVAEATSGPRNGAKTSGSPRCKR